MLDVVLVGSLRLDPAKESAWRALSLADAEMEWPDAAPLFRGETAGEYPTVGALLDAMQTAFAAPSSRSFFERDGDAISGFLTTEHTTAFHQDLTTALRLAGHLGGEGQAKFILPTENVALALVIGEDNDDEAPEWQPTSESFKDEELASDFLEVLAWLKAREANPELPRGAFVASRKSYEVGPMSPPHQQLLAALTEASAARLHPVVSQLTTPRARPLSSVWPDVAALAKAIEGADPLVRVVGIELLARVDAKRAEALAPALGSDTSSFVRRAAVSALAHVPTAGAVDQLLAAMGEDERGPWVLGALVENKSPSADEKLLAVLDAPAPFGASLWTDLTQPGPGRAAAANHATRILHALGKRKSPGALPRLFSTWTDHPSREVRKEAARALAFHGGPEVEARQQDLMFTLMGMGKALNSDDKRRRQLLGITKKDDGGILRFADLDAPRLEKLADEGFLDPQGTQNDSPSAAQFYGIMRDHPEVTATGYAVSAKRFDYRVSLEGIYVDLSKVPAERKEPLREIFTQLGESATNSELDGDGLSLWWT